MNKEELSQAISEGIDNSFPATVFKGIFIGILIFSTCLIIFGVINLFNYEPESLTMGSCDNNLKPLYCQFLIGNTTATYWTVGNYDVCGYQEAKAVEELMRPWIVELVLEDNEWANRSEEDYLSIKYLECKRF